ncbi:MAG: site-2 protease family protein [Gammaproteobacteria bacterium]|nr:site-2 protease family protein [Gammaproteobacteria bacterium]
MIELSLLQKIAVWVVPVIFAITVHETMHGYAASRLGDPTARMLGRLTLNPIKHIDPIGTVLVPGFLLLVGGFLFGWAKPVPITWENFRHPKRDVAIVSAAGPLANLLMAIFWALLARATLLLADHQSSGALYLLYISVAGMVINTVLMVLNLLPLPPLDGGRILGALLPGPYAWQLSRIEPYGFIILVTLIVTGVLAMVMNPLVMGVVKLLIALSGISYNGFNVLFAGIS